MGFYRLYYSLARGIKVLVMSKRKEFLLKAVVFFLSAIVLVQAVLLFLCFYKNQKLYLENTDLKMDNKQLLNQVQICNDEFERWNNSYMARDYCERNGVRPINIKE